LDREAVQFEHQLTDWYFVDKLGERPTGSGQEFSVLRYSRLVQSVAGQHRDFEVLLFGFG
jgi:hypothetical protein